MTIEMAEQILGVYMACTTIEEDVPVEPGDQAAQRIKIHHRRYGNPRYRIRHNHRDYCYPFTSEGYQAALEFARTIKETSQ